jgi:hypothetical protein
VNLRLATGLAAGALLLMPGPAAPQTVLWAGFGRNVEDASSLVTGESLAAGVAHVLRRAGFAAAAGVPVDSDAAVRWATLGGWFDRRLDASPLGIAGDATLFGYGDPARGVTGAGSVSALEGYATLAGLPVDLVLRVGARHGAHAEGGTRSQRLLGRAGGEGAFRTGPLETQGMLDHWLAPEGGYTQAGARLGLTDRRVRAWAGISRWLGSPVAGSTGWDVGASLALTDRLTLDARGGLQLQDILFRIPSQRTWAVALQLRTGASSAGAGTLAGLSAPLVHERNRPVTLSLPDAALPAALRGPPAGAPLGTAVGAAPGVAGTFSGWETLPMTRGRAGWELQLVLPPGVHEFSFVTADGQWFVPEGTAGRKPDGFGGYVAVVIVP